MPVLVGIALPFVAQAQLEWGANGNGGDGTWDTSHATWSSGGAATPWQSGADARFGGSPGTITLGDSLVAGQLDWAVDGYALHLDSPSQSLRASAIAGSPVVRFSGNIGGNADAYPQFAAQKERGLILQPDSAVEVTARLEALSGGSPFFSVRGTDSVVTFNGDWIADTGSIFSWLMPVEGGTFRIGAGADFRFIKEAFYTLQLWVQGDGTGTLEIEEGFVADRTRNAQEPIGIGSIRLSNTTLITHHSQNLPLGFRPKSSEATQANGHMVFENEGGSTWITRSNDQVYPGAVWIYRNLTIHTETNLTHTGVTESGSDYTALNGWSVFGNTVRKTGPAHLTLAGEQSYNPGSLFLIDEGTVTFATDPSAGTHFSGGTRVGTLDVRIANGADAHFLHASRIGSLEASGRWSLSQPLTLAGIDGLWLEPQSETVLTLTQGSSVPLIQVDFSAILSGKLTVWRGSDYTPPRGTRIALLMAGLSSGGIISMDWELQDYSGLGLSIERNGDEVFLVTSRRAGEAAGEVIMEDEFNNIDQWTDLSAVPKWGSPLASRSAFSTQGGAVQLIRSGPDNTFSYVSYSSSSSLKTFTALDFQFPQPVDRSEGTLIADIRLRWNKALADSGEGGRFIVAFNHAYPAGGLDLTPEGQAGSKVADFSAAWWARPAYHIRLRNSTTGAGTSFLQYGGGASPLGEYERTDSWWLPGFISGAGGVAPGAGDDFPSNSWVRTVEGMASETFTLFRYVLHADRQELWRDDDGNGLIEPDELKAVMPLPANSTAPLYQYINTIEGIRLFWNGNAGGNPDDPGQVFVDSFRLTLNATEAPEAHASIPTSQIITNGISGAVRLDASQSSLSSGAAIYQWRVNGEWRAASPDPQVFLRLPLGTHHIELLVSDAFGNLAHAGASIIISAGNLRPIARAGADQTLVANDRLLARVTLDGSSSSDPDGAIAIYEWSRTATGEILQSGANPVYETVLPVGLHAFSLRVTDNEGASDATSARVQVNAIGGGNSFTLYLENFSRPNDGIERGPWDVGWNLMRYDGDPVASVKWDGNAHRSLSPNSSGVYLSKINANPTGTEFDAHNAVGHMWMNQMPFLNATPAEWMLWTDEFVIDTAAYEITSVEFRATDGSPEHVKNSFAARVDGQWYLFWDGRVETQWNFWRNYQIPFSTSGWYRFDPSPTFSVRRAEPADLPPGPIEAFGLYFLKDYGWYVSEIDNFAIKARERVLPPPFLLWQLAHFDAGDLIDDGLQASVWGRLADPNQNGIPNFVEFALGNDPNASSNPPPYQIRFNDAGDPVLAIALNPELEGVTLTLQFSHDLDKWTTINSPSWSFVDVADSPLDHWEIALPMQVGEHAHFFRILWE